MEPDDSGTFQVAERRGLGYGMALFFGTDKEPPDAGARRIGDLRMAADDFTFDSIVDRAGKIGIFDLPDLQAGMQGHAFAFARGLDLTVDHPEDQFIGAEFVLDGRIDKGRKSKFEGLTQPFQTGVFVEVQKFFETTGFADRIAFPSLTVVVHGLRHTVFLFDGLEPDAVDG